jgi:putative membrane protein, TIGR04086 family/integral membrane protein, TIGR04097 family
MKTKKQNTREKSKLDRKGGLNGMGKGIIAACAITIAVFMIYALLLTYTGISEGYIAIVSTVTTAVAAIVAGYFAAQDAQSRGLLWGMVAGVVYVLIILIVLFSAQKDAGISMGKLTGIISAAAGGGIGGILGINQKK